MRREWETRQLGEVIELVYGKPLPDERRHQNGAYPIYGANGEKGRTNEFYHNKKTIIVGRKGSAGELNLTEEKFWPLDVTYFVKFNEKKYDLAFLYYLLSLLELPKLAKGVKPGINRNEVYSINVQIPSLTEQKQIVAILKEAFAFIAKAKANAEQNLKNARDLFESYLQKVYKVNGEGWEKKNLGDICELIMGQSPPGKSYNSNNSGVPLINGPVEFSKEPFSKTIKSKFTTEPTKYCRENDLILCVRGSTTGRINISGFDACIGRGVAAIRYSKNQLWLNYFILASRQKIYDLGSGATFPNVSTEILKKLIIPLPPLSEQHSIIQKLDVLSTEIHKLEAIYQKKLNNLEELKKSILQIAFNGEFKTTQTVPA